MKIQANQFFHIVPSPYRPVPLSSRPLIFPQAETCTGLPFGDGLNCTGTSGDPSPQHFTGKERDSETGFASGNDYFGARYYGSSMGRWLSPDWSENPEPVPYSLLDNPQSLNLYGYVKNNPLSKSDPDGHCDIDGEHHGGVWCFAHALGITKTGKEEAADAQAERQLIASKGLRLPNERLRGRSG